MSINDLAGSLVDRPTYYSDEDLTKLGLSSTSSLGAVKDVIMTKPNGTCISLWINGDTTYGNSVRNELLDQQSASNVFGWLEIKRVGGFACVFTMYQYVSAGTKAIVYAKQFNKVNGTDTWSLWSKLNNV